MAWSSEFIQWITAPPNGVVYPRYLIESVPIADFRPHGGLLLSSWPIRPYTHCIAPDGSSISYGGLSTMDWRRTYSQWTVALTANIDPRNVGVRGEIVQLRVGAAGWDVEQFQVVALGQITALDRAGPYWRLQVRDLVGGLVGRWTTLQDEHSLFYGLNSTTLASDYNGGATMSLTSGAGFVDNDDGIYLVQVHPTSGSPYLVSATSRSGGTLSGCTAGVLDTTYVPAVAGDTVDEAALVEGHPIEVARKLLLSTGGGSNGPHDVLPASWGFGLPSGLVDEGDMDAFIGLTAVSGTDWEVSSVQPQETPVDWMTGWLQEAGMFISQHQGRLTVRAGLGPDVPDTPGRLQLSDADIVSLDGYSSWDPAHSVEYWQAQVTDRQNTGYVRQEDLSTRPAQKNRAIQLNRVNGTDWAQEVLQRIGPYWLRVPERVRITTLGWGAGVASMGDAVAVSTRHLTPRLHGAGGVFDGQNLLMVGGGPNWFGATSTVDLVACPLLETEM